MPPGIIARRETARVARFWRRFHRSQLREQLRSQHSDPEDRYNALAGFLQHYGARFPSSAEMNQLAGWIKQWGPGGSGNDPGEVFQIAQLVQRYLPHIPESVMKFASIADTREFVPSDDDAQRLEIVPADLGEPLPRERFTLPKAIRLERRVRRGLTKWEWQVPDGESPKANVQFLIDSSGSMDESKLALAIASAMKLEARIKAQGHQVSIRFVAYTFSEPMSATAAIPFAVSSAKEALGGGDHFGQCLQELDTAEPTVTDWVIFSDFNIKTWTDRSRKPFWPKAPIHSVFIESIDRDGMECAWWQKPKSRHDFAPILGRAWAS